VTVSAAPAFADADLRGEISAARHQDFAEIPPGLATRRGLYGRSDANAALISMAAAAQEAGVTIRVVSAFRSFADQKRIWEDKWTGRTLVDGRSLAATVPDAEARARAILTYSSMPGTSRHHWGTEYDLNDLEDAYFRSGEGLKLYNWLTANAADFGFCQVYSRKDERRPAGYEEEKWHWSYMPVSGPMLEAYTQRWTDADISGFAGAETATAIGVVTRYVAGINPDCGT
jgi:hypothetical protein